MERIVQHHPVSASDGRRRIARKPERDRVETGAFRRQVSRAVSGAPHDLASMAQRRIVEALPTRNASEADRSATMAQFAAKSIEGGRTRRHQSCTRCGGT